LPEVSLKVITYARMGDPFELGAVHETITFEPTTSVVGIGG